MKIVIALCIVVATISAWAADSGPIVTVTEGQVRGATLDRGGAVFKGIPYAQPPVGDLRWREPMPVRPWTGVRQATEFGPACPQATAATMPSATETSREDCLHLNVWTPEWPSRSRKPVMVWIMGGGNFGGGTLQEVIDGESLTRRGVVVVSLNYRLGSFGFFAHPALTRESPHHASGNQGLLDQIAALEWVRDNVARFGGDARNVTLFGNSAGSIDASVLMTSPLSRGLFRRVIAQSGSVTIVSGALTLQQAEKRGEQLAAGWQMSAAASVKDLRAVSAADILKAEPDYSAPEASFRGPSTFPNLGIVVDGYVVQRQPVEMFASRNEHHVALLHGNTSRDHFGPPRDLKRFIEEEYGPLAQQGQELYVGGVDPMYGPPAEQWASDGWFRCPAVAQLAWHAAAGNPAFEYEFARIPPGRGEPTTHGGEIRYVFGTLTRSWVPGVPPPSGTAVDQQISDVMQQYWTNFAKTGDPNGGQLPVWPTFDVSSRAYIQFTDAGPVAKEGLRRPFCDLFIKNVKRLMFGGSARFQR
jgi:para-nitrobenzyl esterase